MTNEKAQWKNSARTQRPRPAATLVVPQAVGAPRCSLLRPLPAIHHPLGDDHGSLQGLSCLNTRGQWPGGVHNGVPPRIHPTTKMAPCTKRRRGAHRIKPYLGFGVPVGSAYLSARRTFGRPIGRPKVRFNPSPPPCFGRKNGRTFGRPARPAESPAVPSAGRSAGRKYGRTSGRPNRPAESTAVPPAGRVGRPKVRFNPSPPLVVIPPYTNNPPPLYINNTTPAVATVRLLCAPPSVCTALPVAPLIT